MKIAEDEELCFDDNYDILSITSSFCDLSCCQEDEIITINVAGETQLRMNIISLIPYLHTKFF